MHRVISARSSSACILRKALRARSVAKPNISPTLRSLAEHSASLSQLLSEGTIRRYIDSCLQPLTARTFEPGVDAIQAAAEILEHVGDLLSMTGCPGLGDAKDLVNGKAGLNGAVETAIRVAAMLTNLPMACEWELVLLQQYSPLMPSPFSSGDGAHRVRELTTNLTRLALAAADLVTQVRGPRPNTPQMLAVLELKGIFERQTGTRATHSMKSDRVYSGVPESSFGLFATAAFKMMESDARRQRGLAEAIASAVWQRRNDLKAGGASAQAAERERAAYAALERAALQTSRPSPRR